MTTLQYNGVEKALADWGISAATREVSNQAHDHFACDMMLAADASTSTPSSGVLNYTVWMGTNGGVYYTNWSVGTNLTMTVSNITRGTTNCFSVTATDTNVPLTSAASGQAMFTSYLIPNAPTGARIVTVAP